MTALCVHRRGASCLRSSSTSESFHVHYLPTSLFQWYSSNIPAFLWLCQIYSLHRLLLLHAFVFDLVFPWHPAQDLCWPNFYLYTFRLSVKRTLLSHNTPEHFFLQMPIPHLLWFISTPICRCVFHVLGLGYTPQFFIWSFLWLSVFPITMLYSTLRMQQS